MKFVNGKPVRFCCSRMAADWGNNLVEVMNNKVNRIIWRNMNVVNRLRKAGLKIADGYDIKCCSYCGETIEK